MIRTASYRSSSYVSHGTKRSRVIALLLAIGFGLLLIAALVTIGAITGRPIVDVRSLATFAVLPVTGHKTDEAPKAAARPKVAREKREEHAAAKPNKAQPLPTPPITLPGVIMLSRSDFRATDVSRLPKHAEDTAPGAASASAAGDSAKVVGPGEGPGGEQLYYAEWYREPTHAEMATYLPPNTTIGWGMIACRTAERYHVEDCRELGETPGSGISRALRQAAWQFLVRPPRMGSKPMIGSWVRIKYDIVRGAVK